VSSCCFYVFLQQFVVTGISNVVVSSIEKRFFLKSSQVGTIFSCFDIGNLILTIVVSYFGYRHKPKFLGTGAFVFALGCFVFALPQFLADRYKPIVSTSTDLCQSFPNTTKTTSNSTSSHSEAQEELSCRVSKWYFVFLLVVGQLIIGAGASPLFNLGPSYLDENVTQKNGGLVIALYYSIATLGTGAGFILGGYFLAIYVDFVQVL
jgi:MFS family permease